MSLNQYLELLDWTAVKSTGRNEAPFHSTWLRFSERIGINAVGWCDLVKKFGKLFKRAAGTADSIAAEAARRGLGYMHARVSLCLRQRNKRLSL